MFCPLSPQGMLPAKKLALALQACHSNRPCNFTKKDISAFADDMSGVLRAGFAKYRSLVADPEARRRCLSKASDDEKSKIELITNQLIGDGTVTYAAPVTPAGAVPAMRALTGINKHTDFTDFTSAFDFLTKFDKQMAPEISAPSSARSMESIASTIPYSVP